jgi:predicted ATPase
MIKRITIENFFSIREETIELDPQVNIVVGINGSGKSNFLKALKLLQRAAYGDGLRDLIYGWGGFDAVFYAGETSAKDIVLEFEFDLFHLSSPSPKPKNSEQTYDLGSAIYTLTLKKADGPFNYFLKEYLYTERNDKKTVYLDIENNTGKLLSINNLYMFKGLLSDKYPQSFIEQYHETNYVGDNAQESAIARFKGNDFPLFIEILDYITDIAIYESFDTSSVGSMRRPILPTSGKRLLSEGQNLAQILNTIKINDRQCFNRIIEQLSRVNENYRGIDFNILSGNIELMLEEGFNKSIHVSQVSDGTLRFLCLLSIFYNVKRGQLVCIDEPELGLHPDMIHTLITCIKETFEDTQYVIVTHSEHVLDGFEIEKVRVFEKDKKNASVVKQFTTKEFEDWYDEYALGQMWRMGDIGGNRW